MEDYFDRLKRMIIARLMISETSIHGVPHWDRVTENGLHVAQHTGADIAVVKLFAIFHDAQRKNDEDDPDHGRRGAELARDLRQRYFALSDAQFDLLYKVQHNPLYNNNICIIYPFHSYKNILLT